MNRFLNQSLASSIAILGLGAMLTTCSVSADTIIQPVSAFLNGPTDVVNDPNALINQVGLNNTYISGVTDFDTFTATTTGFNEISSSGLAGIGAAPPVTFDFDMGSVVSVNRIAIWNQGTGSASLVGFNLLAANKADYSDALSLGSYSMSLSPTNLADVFSFANVNIRYFRIEATSNNGFATATRLDEFAAAATAVPEPSSLALLLGGAVTVMIRRRKRWRVGKHSQ